MAEVNSAIQPDEGFEESEDDSPESASEMISDAEDVPARPDAEAEYIDEGKYTTVTVEEMDVSREGLRKLGEDEVGKSGVQSDGETEVTAPSGYRAKRKWTKERPKDQHSKSKKKRRNFRYESKAERKLARVKVKLKNSKQAKARRAD